MIVQKFDASGSLLVDSPHVLSEPVAPSAVLGESITIIGSPDALPGICPLLAFDDTLRAADVPPFRFLPSDPRRGTCFSSLRALPTAKGLAVGTTLAQRNCATLATLALRIPGRDRWHQMMSS